MSKSWSTEYAKNNLTSNLISLSFLQTNFTNQTDPRVIERMKKVHSLKRILSKDEVYESGNYLVGSSKKMLMVKKSLSMTQILFKTS